MKLIKHNMLKISYLDKLPFKASYQGIRYMVKKNVKEIEENGEKKNKTTLLLCTYPDKFCFEETKEEDKKYYNFEYSEDGINKIIDFLNEEYKW